MKELLGLFITFFKIGLFTFGGGYAMIPLIQKEVVTNKKWLTDADILDIIAIAESTPGPIAVNTATFVGFKTKGVPGALFATFGLVLPSFTIIYIVSFILRQFMEFPAVAYAFAGIRAGVLALILKALISMYKQCPKGVISYIIMFIAFAAVLFTKINVIFVILFCAAVGLVHSLIVSSRKPKGGDEK